MTRLGRGNPAFSIMTRRITIDMFLTHEEVALAQKMYRDSPNTFHKDFMEQVIVPNIDRINAALGQENDPGYLAYAVEYVMASVSS